MIHYYIQRGHSLDELINLSSSEKAFFCASMILAREEEMKKWGG